MSNMSYCRFRNTLADLRDCQRALDDLMLGQAGPLGEDERIAAADLVACCLEIAAAVADQAGLDLDDRAPSDLATYVGDALAEQAADDYHIQNRA